MKALLQFVRGHWVLSLLGAAAVTVGLSLWLSRPSGRYVEMSPKRGPIIEAIYGLGTVRSDQSHDVKIGVIGTISHVQVREGQAVLAGAPLVTFESMGVFRAPFGGTVTLAPFTEGESVFPQQTAVRIEDLKSLSIEVSLEQRGALRVRKGQPVKVIFESVRGQSFVGEVAALFPRSGEFIARIAAKTLPAEALPGMTADVAIEVARKDDALLVPLKALQQGRLVRLREGRRASVPVEVGTVDGNWAELLKGEVTTDDLVLVPKGEADRP
ncbi:MAG: efflux RND transporter periplasmic adaptor subunit [Bdellovibrionales bacterium]|nr:efflux RND transporter periplasmic adaptor subunit [Bdellovibrionales bacterium]